MPEPGEHTFKLSIDIDLATPTDIQKAFKVWLYKKLIEFKEQHPGVKLPQEKANIGRSAAPQFEALTWLGAYRLKGSGLSYKDAYPEVKRRRKAPEHKDPTCGRFAKLPDFEEESAWYKAVGKAKNRLEQLFTPSGDMFVRSVFLRLW